MLGHDASDAGAELPLPRRDRRAPTVQNSGPTAQSRPIRVPLYPISANWDPIRIRAGPPPAGVAA